MLPYSRTRVRERDGCGRLRNRHAGTRAHAAAECCAWHRWPISRMEVPRIFRRHQAKNARTHAHKTGHTRSYRCNNHAPLPSPHHPVAHHICVCRHGAKVDVRDSNQQQPLHIAAKNAKADMVAHLIEFGTSLLRVPRPRRGSLHAYTLYHPCSPTLVLLLIPTLALLLRRKSVVATMIVVLRNSKLLYLRQAN